MRPGACMTGEIGEADYYRRREQDERKLADLARSPSVRNIHLNLADRYREMAQQFQLKLTGQDQGPSASNDNAASS